MDIVSLKKDIKSKTFVKMYIFVGDNIGLQNIYISKFPNVVREQSISTVVPKLTTRDLFSNDVTTFVIRDDVEFFKQSNAIDILNDFKYNQLILLFTNYDKRSVWFKEFKDYVVEFNQMTHKQLEKIIHDEIDIRDDSVVEAIIERCNQDYSQIVNICDQLRLISGRYTTDLLNSIAPPPIDASIFTAFTYMIKKNPTFFKELEILADMGNPTLKIITSLSTMLDDTVKCLNYDARTCAERFGIQSWIWKTRRNDCKLTIEQREYVAIQLNKCKTHITSGFLDERSALRYMSLKIIENF